MAILDNLISHWPLSDANDAHGTNTLTNSGVEFVTGKIGNCGDFEADEDDYLSIADNASLSTGDIDFTVAAWVQLESTGQDRNIAGKWNGTGNNREWRLYYGNAAGRFQAQVSPDGTGTGLASVNADNLGAPSTGVWYFLVFWHDATANTLNIQVNNGTVDSAAYSGGLADKASDFFIGRIGGGTATDHDGLIDEVSFWKRVLTSDERTLLYNSGNGLAYPWQAFQPWFLEEIK